MVKIAIIVGSTRPGRFGPQAAKWMHELSAEYKDAEFELVDLAEFDLPLLDEVELPAYGNYQNAHTKKWAKVVDAADGYIMVTPEYNNSVPGALKNAIDYLWKEWNYKPVAFVSYGAEAGGTRAVAHLRAISAQMHLFDIREHVAIANYFHQLGEDGTFQPTDAQVKSAHEVLKTIAFWAEKLKPARAELQK